MGKITFEECCKVIAAHVKDRARKTEHDRQIPQASMQELKEAGFFRAFTPRQYGGDQADLLPIFEGLVQLAQGCTSTAWVASLLSIHNFFLRLFAQQAQDELWTDGPDLLLAASAAPSGNARPAKGGYEPQGCWSFLSGVDHCSWAMITAMVNEGNDNPRAQVFLVPASSYSIYDDWHVAGLRGTGSKSIHIREWLFVPEYRTRPFRLNAPKPERGGACWHDNIPWQPLFRLAFVPSAIGTALSTLAAYREQLATRRAPYTGIHFADKQASLIRLAYSSAEVDAASLVLQRDLNEMEHVAKRECALPPSSIERIFFDVAYTLDRCNRAVDRLFLGSGGKALYEENPLQRCFRDMHAIRQHAAADVDLAGELFGKSLLCAEVLSAEPLGRETVAKRTVKKTS